MSIKSAALAHGLKEEIIEIPEWAENGGDPVKVLVKEMTAGTATRFSHLTKRSLDGTGRVYEAIIADVAIACAYDPVSGDKAFDPADRDALLATALGPLLRIQTVAQRLSGLTDAGIEEAEKNSATAAEEPSS